MSCDITGRTVRHAKTANKSFFIFEVYKLLNGCKREQLGEPEESQYKADGSYDYAYLGHILGLNQTGT